jgi:prophage maintenance system killer protein
VAHLQAADILAIHRSLTGATPAAPDDESDPDYDWRRLQDAIDRHQNKVENYPGPYEQGAALWQSLTLASPFTSFQTETAFLALYAFLRVNGLELDVDDSHVADFVSAKSPTQAEMAVFLGRHAD